ncbi:hypothetical protein [Oligoflexus tunisiensis]|nr:hypothetical protein [Oligoflexus tunisiensis]
MISDQMQQFEGVLSQWMERIQKSFLTDDLKEKYLTLVRTRAKVLQFL